MISEMQQWIVVPDKLPSLSNFVIHTWLDPILQRLEYGCNADRFMFRNCSDFLRTTHPQILSIFQYAVYNIWAFVQSGSTAYVSMHVSTYFTSNGTFLGVFVQCQSFTSFWNAIRSPVLCSNTNFPNLLSNLPNDTEQCVQWTHAAYLKISQYYSP